MSPRRLFGLVAGSPILAASPAYATQTEVGIATAAIPAATCTLPGAANRTLSDFRPAGGFRALWDSGLRTRTATISDFDGLTDTGGAVGTFVAEQ